MTNGHINEQEHVGFQALGLELGCKKTQEEGKGSVCWKERSGHALLSLLLPQPQLLPPRI